MKSFFNKVGKEVSSTGKALNNSSKAITTKKDEGRRYDNQHDDNFSQDSSHNLVSKVFQAVSAVAIAAKIKEGVPSSEVDANNKSSHRIDGGKDGVFK